MDGKDGVEQDVDDDISWADMPHLRKVGRYLFFWLCAFSTGMTVYVMLRFAGFSREVASPTNTATMFAVFLVLRDMSKQWDWALEKRAEARKSKRVIAEK